MAPAARGREGRRELELLLVVAALVGVLARELEPLESALALHRAGDLAAAQRGYRELASPTARALLGIALCQAQDFAASAPLLRAAAARGDHVAAQFLGAAAGFAARRLAPEAGAVAPPASRAQWEAALGEAVWWFRASIDGAERAAAAGDRDFYPQAEFARPPADAYRGLGDALAWLGRRDEAAAVFTEGAASGHLASALCRPVTALSPAPDLLRLPPPHYHFVFPRTLFADVLGPLEAALPAVMEELSTALADIDGPVPTRPAPWRPETGGLSLGDSWTQLPFLVNGRPQAAACARFPRTCAALAALPEAAVASGQAKLSRMRPGTHVLPHAGPTNARARVHCGLQASGGGSRMRVGNATVEWTVGECFAWAESCEHEVWVDAAAAGEQRRDRIILIVDVANPLLASAADYDAAFAAGEVVDRRGERARVFEEARRRLDGIVRVEGAVRHEL